MRSAVEFVRLYSGKLVVATLFVEVTDGVLVLTATTLFVEVTAEAFALVFATLFVVDAAGAFVDCCSGAVAQKAVVAAIIVMQSQWSSRFIILM